MTTSSQKVDVVDEFPEIAEDVISEKTSTSSFADRVNEAVNNMKQKEDGTWDLPKDLPEEVAYAANAERRRRDTQSAFDKTNQQLNTFKVKAEKLEAKLLANVTLNLSEDERTELQDLKETDPDAWRAKLNEHEQTAKAKTSSELEELDTEVFKGTEIDRRAGVLKDFLESNPGLILNDEVFENDLPPRITGKLARGECTFEEFLEASKNFLTRTKVVKDTTEEEDEPNLSRAGGGDKVSDAAADADTRDSYNTVIF